ncbi:MAG: magnesium transporter [Erysipelotrichaceae bacterium]|nr:magnesium transporter [Erysipelotrichaceae bacterium]
MDNLEITKELLQEFISEKQIDTLREVFDEFNIVDLALFVNELPLPQILFLFKILRKDVSGTLFSYLESENQQGIIEAFTSNDIRSMLEHVYADDMVDVMEDMPANLVKKVLQAASEEQRSEINMLLSFAPNTAGSMMSTDYLELDAMDTVSEAIKKIKRQGKVAETISFCYIVNRKHRLVGAIALRDILFAPVNSYIEDLMDRDVVYVQVNDDQEDVAHTMSKYDIMVLPVVNDQNCLIGIITADDVIDVMEEEVTEDIQKMAAIVPVEESYLDTSIVELVKSRLPWLLALMITATFTGNVLASYEEALAVIPALSAFVPMIMGTAGNAGNQASVMVIRGISVDDLSWKDMLKVLWKEMRVGIICGAILFVVVVIRIMVIPPDVALDIALVIALSTVISLVAANMAGGLLPLLAHACKQDPAVMAAPLIATVIDTLSLMIYFFLSMKLLGI